MSGDVHELPQERLATTDEKGRRVHIYPREVEGRFKRAKNAVHAVLLILIVLPWIEIGGHQAVLLDIPRRKFAILGVTFWAHDVPMLFLVVASLILTIMIVTAIWGRAWCGWACPQTVFIEAVFRRIERFAEGDSVERRRRDQGPWTAEKAARRALKWALYLGFTMIITHSVLAYFVGADRIFGMVTSSPSESPTAFAVTAFFTALLLFDFGWFREQFCVIMCPYGRFQSVLLDRDSYTVSYDAGRGEPRKGSAMSAHAGVRQGDCVSCYRCVAVCPTGIDIRRGSGQLECIACTACVDACDDVMRRLGKPEGLIRYDTERGLGGERPRARLLRPRILVIGGALIALFSAIAVLLGARQELDLTVLRPKGMPYQVVDASGPGGVDLVINRFVLEVVNQTFDPLSIQVRLAPEDAGRGFVLMLPETQAEVGGGRKSELGFFVRFPRSVLEAGAARAVLEIEYSGPGPRGPAFRAVRREELRLAGPAR